MADRPDHERDRPPRPSGKGGKPGKRPAGKPGSRPAGKAGRAGPPYRPGPPDGPPGAGIPDGPGGPWRPTRPPWSDRPGTGRRPFEGPPQGGGRPDRGRSPRRAATTATSRGGRHRPDRGPWRPPTRGGPPPDRGPWRPPTREGPPPDRGPWRPESRGGPPPGRGQQPHQPRPPGPPRTSPGPWPRPPRDDAPWPRQASSLPAPDLLGPDEELVAGRRPVEEVFASGRTALRLLVVPHRRNALEQLVLHATRLRIPIVEVEGGSLTAIAGFDGHQGVAVIVEPRQFATLEDILARAADRGEPPFVLVLDSLEDPQNLGTLLRSAEAAGVHGVIFPTRRQAPLSAAAVKASAGATEHLLLCPVDDLPGALADLHVSGLRIAGSEADAPLTARQTDLRGPLAIVVGSEGQGLGPAIRRRCDTFMRIPMRGAIGSLNAAVAGSVLLFEAVAQRDAGGPTAPPRERRPQEPTADVPDPDADGDDPPPARPPPAKAPSTADVPSDSRRRPPRRRTAGRSPKAAPRDRTRSVARGVARNPARRRPPAGRPIRRPAAGGPQAPSAAHPPRLTHRRVRPYHSPAPVGSAAVCPCASRRRSSIGRAAVL